ncbi:hypothetical protein BDB00DRAFT_934953 [Zychaea mexicana]|uniref:uncharacterized protein n=1 Tax=Zychaea mexicana TaxID=64656 RepID=UPI0022FE9CAF|nr:uncharacterized protein BDB00DRAFT_934953 [Zychaea mexicana]KAI9499190.1 hypothetical protein BDB00DRAFT_934953 [Zychaea mexicana]
MAQLCKMRPYLCFDETGYKGRMTGSLELGQPDRLIISLSWGSHFRTSKPPTTNPLLVDGLGKLGAGRSWAAACVLYLFCSVYFRVNNEALRSESPTVIAFPDVNSLAHELLIYFALF